MIPSSTCHTQSLVEYSGEGYAPYIHPCYGVNFAQRMWNNFSVMGTWKYFCHECQKTCSDPKESGDIPFKLHQLQHLLEWEGILNLQGHPIFYEHAIEGSNSRICWTMNSPISAWQCILKAPSKALHAAMWFTNCMSFTIFSASCTLPVL